MTNMPKHSNSNAAIDIMKFVLSIFVVAIHSLVDLGIFTPIFRIAVPFFFICSSYFLFGKLEKANNTTEKKQIVKAFLKRNVLLYAFWLAIQLSMVTRGWWGLERKALLLQIMKFPQLILFGNTFGASWYLSAMVLGCLLFYWLSKILPQCVLLILGGLAYIFCLLYTSYDGLVCDSLLMSYAVYAYGVIFLSPANGLVAGFLWIAIGQYLASRKGILWRQRYWVFGVGIVGLLIENWMVRKLGWLRMDDCYLMLIPTCYGLFQVVRSLSWKCECSIKLRNMSTIIYVSHGTVVAILWPLIPWMWVRFVAVVLTVALLGVLILWLQKHKRLAWLRYVY